MEGSLKTLGFTIEPTTEKSAKGDQFVYKVTGPPQTFYIKKTRTGKLRAFKEKDAKVDSLIAGLWDFEEQNGDLIGKKPPEPKPRPQTQAA